jgi:catechol 2,3-dioxygenase-like lactoylglutathione lyase family enzyme
MFLGLRTVIYPADDLAASKAWFTKVLGIEPYFDEPFYVGFNVEGYELGIIPADDTTTSPLAYWGVADADAALHKLIEAGAIAHIPVSDVGGGIRTASVVEPSGGVLGIIENPHFTLPA